ncbi:MAG: SDR family NAD(P)-dependent oxidoreductase [Gemmatimonadales bacterium]|nr:SDR family NAD(P)-dependent oxidoreductase [Gemmatimonadales bacterium]
MMGTRIEGHVIITGAAGGLGEAVLDALVSAGATCHVPVRGAVPSTLAGRAGVVPIGSVDLADEASVERLFADLPPLVASIHLVGGYEAKPIAETTREVLDRQLSINLVTTFLSCREAIKALRRSGGGRIVNVGARVSEVPMAGSAAYTAAKGAVAALTRALAEEVRQEGILVNAVAPSIIDTPANRAAMPAANHDRWPKPAELAQAILWLASTENALTSGAIVPVYGRA